MHSGLNMIVGPSSQIPPVRVQVYKASKMQPDGHKHNVPSIKVTNLLFLSIETTVHIPDTEVMNFTKSVILNLFS